MMRTIGRVAVGSLVSGIGISAWLAVPALATPVDNTRGSGSDSFVTVHTCADPVRVDSTWSIVVHTHYDAAGDVTRIEFTGTTRIAYTDLESGRTFAPNSSGPGTLDAITGVEYVRGSNAAIFTNDGTLVATNGLIIYDPAGEIVKMVGHQQPVCEALGTVPYSG